MDYGWSHGRDLLGCPFREYNGLQVGVYSLRKPIYGLIKATAFAFIIGSVSAYSGYSVKGGAVEAGIASTNAVVARV